ncbi:molecular chaperone HtpG, partial [uncultured Porphyromonas sp.]|uniref:heat shock protein Hsp90 family protein n=1 Tax=uncultured Porphyromonas sp. TaxID=159274 RepID=UPI0025CD9539
EEDKEFLDENRILALLKKYCSYLPVPIVFGKEKEWKDGKQVDTDKPRVINETDPMWIKQPSSLTDEDYKEFYRTLFPGNDAPLFWIHLNIDYPFNLTGILYFPQIKSNLDMQKSNISLYCNQVYVTDNVEGIVPDFLNLLHGVIDSPDIPLNVSRSYLQSDARVKKISTYITRKVADKLAELFKSDRAAYEEKWPALDLFVKYGMLTDEKFAEKAKGILLLKDTDEKYYTLEEYKTLIEGNQTDKDKKVIHLYAQDPDRQYSYIRAAKDKGYSVLLLNGPLDMHLIGMLEQKSEDSHFVSVDSDTLENLVRKDEKPVGQVDMTEEDQSILKQLFQSRVPEGDEKQMIHVATANQGAEAKPIVVIQNEYMRRMKDMAHMQQGMDMYGSMPDSYMMTLNIDHPLIGAVLKRFRASDQIDTYTQLMGDRNGFVARRAEIDSQLYDDKNKPDEAKKKSLEEDLKETNAHIDELDAKLSKIYADFAAGQPVIEHLIDLALLASGLLRGEALDRFVSDSMSAISDKLDD